MNSNGNQILTLSGLRFNADLGILAHEKYRHRRAAVVVRLS
jgi:hypothetical protein